jgi:hypothetical protein
MPSLRKSVLISVFMPLFVGVVLVQGVHVVEHIIQLAQVYLFGVADDDALGVLGYILQFQGTEEWLHLGFNVSYLLALYVLLLPMRLLVPRTIPVWAFGVFAVGAAGLETWHVVEHSVIIANVLQNNGCPCPGIGDAALGLTDTVLHFVYNSVAFAATVTPFVFLVGTAQRRAMPALSRT